MARESSSVDRSSDESGTEMSLSLPVPDMALFKLCATGPILQFLADSPELDFSVSVLSIWDIGYDTGGRDAFAGDSGSPPRRGIRSELRAALPV